MFEEAPVFPWTDSRSFVTPLIASKDECVISYVGRMMSRVSVEPHHEIIGTGPGLSFTFLVSIGQSPTLI